MGLLYVCDKCGDQSSEELDDTLSRLIWTDVDTPQERGWWVRCSISWDSKSNFELCDNCKLKILKLFIDGYQL